MPSTYAMEKYPEQTDKMNAFDEGAIFALRKVAEENKGRVTWPGDLKDIADDWVQS